MSLKEFVRRSEIKSRENIRRAYIDIDMCYTELDILNDQLVRYSNMFLSRGGLHPSEKQKRISEIRERIPKVYEYITYYKDCINYEKSEISRICTTYGFEQDKKYNRDFSEYIPRSEYAPRDNKNYVSNDFFNDYTNEDTNYNDAASYVSEVSQIIEEETDEEEYKFNPETGAFE
jgi:hypothetical protein